MKQVLKWGASIAMIALLIAACADPVDRVPDAFSFAPVIDAVPGAEVTSEEVEIRGINTTVEATVSAEGTLVVNGDDVGETAQVSNGALIAVRVAASEVSEGVASATVTVGGVEATFVVTTQTIPADGPDAFSFERVIDAEPGSTVTSNAVEITGIDVPITATVSAGGELVVDGAPSGAEAEIGDGTLLAVRVTASNDSLGEVSVTVTLGGVEAVFEVITRAIPNETPDGFSFEPVTGAEPGSTVTSNTVVITGIDVPITATVSAGGELIVNGAPSGAEAEVVEGAELAVQVVASAVSEGVVTATVTVGGVSSDFVVTSWVIPVVTLNADFVEAAPGDVLNLTWEFVGNLDTFALTSSSGLVQDVTGLETFAVTLPSDSPSVSYTVTGTNSANPILTANASVDVAVPLWVCVDPANVITFEDAELEGYFRDLLSLPADGDLTCAQAQSVDVWDLVTWQEAPGNVASLVGVQHLVNMTEFWAEFNDIADLTPVAGLTNLEVLHLDGNRVLDLAPIADLTNLRLLGLWDNGPERIPPEDPAFDPAVYCRDGISDISALTNLVNLEVLYLSCNNVSDISALANKANLELAFLILNQIDSIAPLSGLTNLQALRFSENLVATDDGVLGTLAGLRWLEMAYNRMEDDSLVGLGLLTNLFAVDLEGNYFTDLSPITGNAALPGAVGTGDDQEPAVATVFVGYNCIANPEAVRDDLVLQGFAVNGVDEPGAQQRTEDNCLVGPPVGPAADSLQQERLEMYRDRMDMR